MALNRATLIGNVGGDPEIRYLNDNTKVARFTVATTDRYKDRNGEQKEATEWHTCVAWRNTADLVEKYIKQGTPVFVEGKLRTRAYQSNGVEKTVTEIVVDRMQFFGKRETQPVLQQRQRVPSTPQITADDFTPAGDDGFPF